MWPFKCKHPAQFLVVDRDETHRRVEFGFTITTYHLFCELCDEPVKITHAKKPENFWERKD